MMSYNSNHGNHLFLTMVYIMYFTFCVTTYILIFKKIFESRRNTQTNAGNESSDESGFIFYWRQIKLEGYIIPLLITFTYLLLVVIPLLINVACFLAGVHSESIYLVWQICMILNSISDALIYVLWDRDIQKHLKNMIARIRRNDENNMSNIEMDVQNTTHAEYPSENH